LRDGTKPTELLDERVLSAASTDAQLNSTFSFQVDGAQLTATTQLSVAIQELECGDDVGTAANARFPTTGTRACRRRCSPSAASAAAAPTPM
jgi:hypothetical protein